MATTRYKLNGEFKTKVDFFADIRARLDGSTPPNGIPLDDVLAFVDNESALVIKKNNSRKTVDTAADDAAKTLIYDFLAVQDSGKTVTEIWKGIPEFVEHSTMWVTPRVRALVDEGRVINEKVKGKSLFRVA